MQLMHQKGFILLEGLICISLLAIALISLAFFQSNMIKQATNIQYRAQATGLIRVAIAEMEVDPTKVKCYTTADSCGDIWRGKVAALSGDNNTALGVSHNLKVTVGADSVVTIGIYWSLMSEKDLNNQPIWHHVQGRFAPIASI